MSMSNYPEYGFGLIFKTNDEINTFINSQKNIKNLDSESLEDSFMEACEKLEHCVRYYDSDEFEGSSWHMLNGESGEYDSMLVIWTLNQPDIFKAAYIDVYAIEKEMRKEFSFPSDFDWKAHLGYFSGCVFC